MSSRSDLAKQRALGRGALDDVRRRAPAILPSMLMCDFGHLADEVARLEEAGAAALHLDVMDGHFVPNFTYGLSIVEAVRALTQLPLDTHLMIAQPQRFARQFVEAGADVVTIHVEAVDDPRPVLEEIRSHGAAAGIALNPPTPVATITRCLDTCDLVLVMSVMPGFGAQAFQPAVLEKLRQLRGMAREGLVLQVDGGVNQETIRSCRAAGAQLMVVGSAIFRTADYGQTIRALLEQAEATSPS